MNTGWIIFITAGKWQVSGIKKAKEMGHKIVAVDDNKNADGFIYSDLIINENIFDTNKIISVLKEKKIVPIGAISFCSEVGMTSVAKLNEYYNLPGLKLELTNALLDKSIQRTIWKDNNVEGPSDFQIFHNFKDAYKYLSQIQTDYIIKPTRGAGSRGVKKIAYSNKTKLKEVLEISFNASKTGTIIAEQYMPGVEYTVEVLIQNGNTQILTVTEKDKVEGTDGLVASTLRSPTCSNDSLDKIKNLVTRAYKALNHNNGIGHAEVILSNDGKVGMVEAAGRGGGFGLFELLIPKVTGIDIVKKLINLSVGINEPLRDILDNKFILDFFPSKKGILKEIKGFDKIDNRNNVYAISFVEVGQVFDNPATDGDRLGYIFCIGSTIEEVQNKYILNKKHIDFIFAE